MILLTGLIHLGVRICFVGAFLGVLLIGKNLFSVRLSILSVRLIGFRLFKSLLGCILLHRIIGIFSVSGGLVEFSLRVCLCLDRSIGFSLCGIISVLALFAAAAASSSAL